MVKLFGVETSWYRDVKGAKHQLGTNRLGAKRFWAKRLEGDRTSGGNDLRRNDSDSRRQDRNMFYPLESRCV